MERLHNLLTATKNDLNKLELRHRTLIRKVMNIECEIFANEELIYILINEIENKTREIANQ